MHCASFYLMGAFANCVASACVLGTVLIFLLVHTKRDQSLFISSEWHNENFLCLNRCRFDNFPSNQAENFPNKRGPLLFLFQSLQIAQFLLDLNEIEAEI